MATVRQPTVDPTFKGPSRFFWRAAEPGEPLDLAGFDRLAAQLADRGLELRIGAIVHHDGAPLRFIVDGGTGRATSIDRRLTNSDAEAVIITDPETMAAITAGTLDPIAALRRNRLAFTGSFQVLLDALTVFSCSTQPIPAPCEGAV